MPHINLIQEQRSQARRNETKARGGFFAFVAITSLSAADYGAMFLQDVKTLLEDPTTMFMEMI